MTTGKFGTGARENAVPIFRILQADSDALMYLGFAKNQARRLIELGTKTFSKTWLIGDITVRARGTEFFGDSIVKIWLIAAGTAFRIFQLGQFVNPSSVSGFGRMQNGIFSYTFPTRFDYPEPPPELPALVKVVAPFGEFDSLSAFKSLVADGNLNDVANIATSSIDVPNYYAMISGGSWVSHGVRGFHSTDGDSITLFVDGGLAKFRTIDLFGFLADDAYDIPVLPPLPTSGDPPAIAQGYSVSCLIGDEEISRAFNVPDIRSVIGGDAYTEHWDDVSFTRGEDDLSATGITSVVYLKDGKIRVLTRADHMPVIASEFTDFDVLKSNAVTSLKNTMPSEYLTLTTSETVLIASGVIEGVPWYEYNTFITSQTSGIRSAGVVDVYNPVPGPSLAERPLAVIEASFSSAILSGVMVFVIDHGGPTTTEHVYQYYAVAGPSASAKALLWMDGHTTSLSDGSYERIGPNLFAGVGLDSQIEEITSPGFGLHIEESSSDKWKFTVTAIETDKDANGNDITKDVTVDLGTVGSLALFAVSSVYAFPVYNRDFDSDISYSEANMSTFRTLGFDGGDGALCAFLPFWWNANLIRKLMGRAAGVESTDAYNDIRNEWRDYGNAHPSTAQGISAKVAVNSVATNIGLLPAGTVLTAKLLLDEVLKIGRDNTVYAVRVKCSKDLPLFLGNGDFACVSKIAFPRPPDPESV